MPRFSASACLCWLLLKTGVGLRHTKWDPAKNHTRGVGTKGSGNSYMRYTEEELPKEPMLLYVHNEKTGGSFMDAVMAAAVGDKNHLGYHQMADPVEHVPDNYFVVMNVRNPCTRSISAWSYNCEKAWVFRNLGIDDSAVFQNVLDRLDAGKCPKFNGTSKRQIEVLETNVAGFRERFWKKAKSSDEALLGLTKKMPGGHKRVNCWIKYEDFQDTSRECLKKYEKFTGKSVNWASFDSAWTSARHNEGHHDECKAYFEDPEFQRHVIDANPVLRDEFGYHECCTDEGSKPEGMKDD